MRKLISTALAAAMILSLAACGSSSGSAASTTAAAAESAQSEASEIAEKAALPKTITVQVPAKAGGGTDVMARALANKIAENSGSNLTIVNNSDGNGVVAMETVRTAKGDGSSILQYHTTMTIKTATNVYGYSAAEDFKVIAVAAPVEAASYTLVTSADSGIDTLEKFIEEARSRELKIGVETGGQQHLISGMFIKALDLGDNVKCVEAGSHTEEMTALVGGSIDATFVNINQAKQYIDAGKVYALAVVGDGDEATRSSIIPEVPNFQELGYDISWVLYNFILGPKDMDDSVARTLWQYYADAAEDDSVNEILEPAGLAMRFVPYEDGQSILQEMQEISDPIVEELGLKQ